VIAARGPALVILADDGTGACNAAVTFAMSGRRARVLLVAMYHDQGHIAAKLAGSADTVNVTPGLPLVRTSVDHGTGYDIAGTGKADERNLVKAIALAASMAGSR
jgi:4-hydroxythreonine-4-phosphate dehydrogenase